MTHYFKLTEGPYGTGKYNAGDHIQVSVSFVKTKGYCIVADLVGYENHVISKAFCAEYYRYYNDLCIDCVSCMRRSKKQEEIAETYCDAHAREIAERWIEFAISRGGKAMTIVDEVK